MRIQDYPGRQAARKLRNPKLEGTYGWRQGKLDPTPLKDRMDCVRYEYSPDYDPEKLSFVPRMGFLMREEEYKLELVK